MNYCSQCEKKALTYIDLGNEKRWLCPWHIEIWKAKDEKHEVEFVRASQL